MSYHLPAVCIAEVADVVAQSVPHNLLVQDANGQEPVGIVGAYHARCLLVTVAHQGAALRAFHQVAYDGEQVVGAEDVRGGKVERPKAADVHVCPPATFFVQQFVPKDVGKARKAALPVPKGVAVPVAEDGAGRQDAAGIAQDDSRRQGLYGWLVSPKMKFMPLCRE